MTHRAVLPLLGALLLASRLAGQDVTPSVPPLPSPAAPAILPELSTPELSPEALAATRAVAESAAGTLAPEPPALEHPTYTEVPYGHMTPTLRCAPLRVCVVELQEGEIVLATMFGDSTRWVIDRAVAGPQGRTPLLALKPTDCDLATNLFIATDRRLYQLLLSAPPCPGGRPEAASSYTPLLRFYYPDELVHSWQSAAAAQREAGIRDEAARLPLAAPVPLADLNFRYAWSRAGRYPWAPEIVFDDGVHTYIRLPLAARQHPAPVLLVLGDDGATGILNYSYQGGVGDGGFYVTDRVLDRAALVLGTGRRQHRLTITNEALRRP